MDNPSVAESEAKAAGTIQASKSRRKHHRMAVFNTIRESIEVIGHAVSLKATVIKDAQFRSLTTPAAPSSQLPRPATGSSEISEKTPSSPGARKNWQRVGLIARRANTDDLDPSNATNSADGSESSSSDGTTKMSPEQRQARRKQRSEARDARKKGAKVMGLQYFLEMVDQKHRHGSNLRKYHNYWKSQQTSENFFYWLDLGEGKDVDLSECSRAKLNKEQVRYLSREERLKYLVVVDKQGLLRWAKNGEKVWTNDTMFKDSLEGIVPVEEDARAFRDNVSSENLPSDSSSSEGSDKDGTDQPPDKKKTQKWIYVADTSFRLFVGIKQRGSFQHSSFLHGSRISAAGQIKIKEGHLRSLAPLSGHYRPPAANFRAFVSSLRAEGVDMSQISVSKSYAVLLGIEGYGRTKRKWRDLKSGFEQQKGKILHSNKSEQKDEHKKDAVGNADLGRRKTEEQITGAEEKPHPEKVDTGLSARIARSLRLD